MLVVPHDDGTISIGAASMPAFAARDLAVRILEACGNVPEEVAGRIRCRQHLDALFAGAEVIDVRDMQTRAIGRFPALRDGRRLVVRLGDSVTATLLEEGERFRGFAVQHRDDAIFGVVGEVMRPFVRFSAAANQARQIREKV